MPHVRCCGRPNLSSWNCVRFEIGEVEMGLDQSPLATSSRYAPVGGQYFIAASIVAIVR